MKQSTLDSTSQDSDSALEQAQHQVTLLGLPLFVVQLVLELLDRKDIYSFRLVSRACRHLSESVVFRTLAFHNRTRTSDKIFTNLCQRLCDPEDVLREIVHHVRVGPLANQASYLSEAMFEKAIDNIRDLQDFSWHMRFAIPDNLLQLLHTRHTSTRIHIVNPKRNIDRQYIPPDKAALSSPQLYSLDYTAYGANERVARLEWDFYSELSNIKAYLLKARNLKSLCLRVSSDNIPRQSFWTIGPKCLTFNSGENFPPLQKLRFEFETFDMSEKYCEGWVNAMDWTQLRRLDLDGGSPSNLLVALTGRVSQLKVLSFGFRDPTYTWGYPNADVFQAFSDSISGLEDVVASNSSAQPFDEIRDTFFSKHGHSLKRLKVSYGATGQGWEEADVQGLAEKSPGICDLALKIATVGDFSGGWPKATMQAFRAFGRLRTLEVTLRLDKHLELHQESTDLLDIQYGAGGSPHFYLKEGVCREHVSSLYKQLLNNSAHPSIESVKVNFQTNHQFNEWVFVVKSQSCNTGKVPVETDFFRANPKRRDEVTPAGTSWDPFG